VGERGKSLISLISLSSGRADQKSGELGGLDRRGNSHRIRQPDIRLRVEIKAGEMLREMEKNKGARSQGRPKIGGSSERPPKNETPKLSDLGVSKDVGAG
jgi:hypothetical protein